MHRAKTLQLFPLLSGFFIYILIPVLRANADSVIVKQHDIHIELFPEEHTFHTVDKMQVVAEGLSPSLRLNRDFKVIQVLIDGSERAFSFSPGGALEFESLEPGEHGVTVVYSGSVYDKPGAAQMTRQYVASQSRGIISEEGTYLSPASLWYPRGEEVMALFTVGTLTPLHYESVTQGERILRENVGEKLRVVWKNSHPADSCTLQAGPYEIGETEIDGIRIYTYFFPGSQELSALYLEKSKQYIGMYNKLLGLYPYKKFAVVENFFETGYGMPSWTLLGKTVIRLPFIPDTSLPHEICHNWWGNGVFIDTTYGNWCEGLTVYCADYLLKNKTPAGGKEYRMQTNRDYSSYVKDHNDFPLTKFRSRHDPATRSVGYGKTMMVFHALQRRIGEENFFRSLRRLAQDFAFRPASWKDVLAVFEEDHGLNLGPFFTQWIERPGAPEIRMKDVSISENQRGFSLHFTLEQEGEPYSLDIPVRIVSEKAVLEKSVSLSTASREWTLTLNAQPQRLEIDPDCHLFRRLYPEEVPPSIAKVFGSKSQVIVLGSAESPAKAAEFEKAAQMINRTKTAVIMTEAEIAERNLEGKGIIILGRLKPEAPIARWLSRIEKPVPWPLGVAEDPRAGQVVVYRHPTDGEQGVMVILGNEECDPLSIARKIPHYGKYSYLMFHKDQNVFRGIWDIEESPLIYRFRQP